MNHVTYTFRSTDGGQTWSEGYPVCPTGEPSVIELASGRLLAVIRDNLIHPATPVARAVARRIWRSSTSLLIGCG